MEAMEKLENNEKDTEMHQDICRLCDCESDENGEMFSIFDRNEEGYEILHLIHECLPLRVYKTDSLSKSICADCLEHLTNSLKFKKKCLSVANQHKENLRSSEENDTQEELSLPSNNEMENGNSEVDSKNDENSDVKESIDTKDILHSDAHTSTDDIIIFCNNCRSEILDAHKVDSEIELCAELHQAIAESFSRNKIVTSDKMLRSRRKRTVPFYQELEDSLCSSLTEFTNTESTQYLEFQSDIDSVEDDEDKPVKRRRMEKVCPPPSFSYVKKFEDEEEYNYNPLSLLQLCLNIINQENIPEYEPDEFSVELIEPECTYCGTKYRNRKLLALHEISHMSIELGEKVDNPILWHESRDGSHIRNKWLTSEDDVEDEENVNETLENMESMEVEGIEEEEEDEGEEESLLIHTGTAEQRDGKSYDVTTREVTLVEGKPFVDGLPLSDYPKEERRVFYHTMKVGGVTKRFCTLCRYSFKDNWAIESHYFSMACYYTCRYCGMRFNKQRSKYEEHVETHVRNKDEYSTKVYAASKHSNVVPKVLYPSRRHSGREPQIDPFMPKQAIEVKNYDFSVGRKSLQSEIKVKQEMGLDNDYQMQNYQPQYQTSQSKTGNQAYFCRKCYKVFFKLDEFNIHSRNCDYNQFPSNSMLGTYLTSGSKPNGEPANTSSASNSGRPVRNCAKEAGPYRDEAYLPDHILKDQVHSSASQGPFICYICNTPFPTVYSRNSHMRIHKAEIFRETPSAMNQSPQQRFQPSSYQEPDQYQTSVAHLAQVKQEPLDLEPEVEIHETPTQDNDYSPGLSPAVSITPISKNPNQKLQLNPNVIKLVQNNPQLSIKSRDPPAYPQQPFNQNQQMQQHIQQMLSGQGDQDRTYKCSSCWEAFTNKSHLYFHKKNQCEGSKYPCPFCKKRFGTEAAYSSHIFYSHPE